MWFSHYLSIIGKVICTHEACEFAGNPEQFWKNADDIRPAGGTYGNADSSNLFVLPSILAERPMTKVVWVNRNVVEVCKSMQVAGIGFNKEGMELMLNLRNRYCEYFDMMVDYETLGSETIQKLLWELILPEIPFDVLRFRKYNAQQICYTKSNPMPRKETKLFVGWANRELQQPVEK